MTLYWLTEWEHNGRDDSDWYAVLYDSEQNELRRDLIGTTRGGNCIPCTGRLLNGTQCITNVPDDIMAKAEKCLAEIIYNAIRPREHRDVFEPDKLEEGVRVKLSEDHFARRKIFDEENCIKCKGSGKWINPRNEKDERICFACNGLGKFKRNFRLVLECNKCNFIFDRKSKENCPACNANKKDVRIVLDKVSTDTAGKVISTQAHGKFYSNGYNRPNRYNTSVIVLLDDGRELTFPLKKLRLEREPLTDEELHERAKELSKHRNFYAPFATAGVSML